MGIRQRFRSGSSKLMMYFTAMVLFILLCGFLPLYLYLSDSLKKESEESTRALLQQIIRSTDEFFEQTDNKLIRISVNKQLETILFRRNNELYDNKAVYYSDLTRLSADLYNEQLDVPSIESIYVYLPKANTVLTNQRIYSWGDFPDHSFVASQFSSLKQAPSRLPHKIPRILNTKAVISIVQTFGVSEEGQMLTQFGIKDIHYTQTGTTLDSIKLNEEERAKEGKEHWDGDRYHQLAAPYVSWVPQSVQDFFAMYGKDQAAKDWYSQMWDNQLKYMTVNEIMLNTTPKWSSFNNTSNDLTNEYFNNILLSKKDDADSLFAEYVDKWNKAGGLDAAKEMNEAAKKLKGE